MLTYESGKPSNHGPDTHGSAIDQLHDLINRFWYDVLPFLVAILLVEWGVVAGLLIGDAIKGGWT